MSYTKNEKRTNYQAATIDNNSNPVLFSFRRRRSTHCLAGNNVNHKRTKKNDQAATIDNNSNPVIFYFRGRRSTYCLAGHDVNHKRTKENDQAATIDNNSDTRATMNKNNSPLPRMSNNKLCVAVVELD